MDKITGLIAQVIYDLICKVFPEGKTVMAGIFGAAIPIFVKLTGNDETWENWTVTIASAVAVLFGAVGVREAIEKNGKAAQASAAAGTAVTTQDLKEVRGNISAAIIRAKARIHSIKTGK